MRHSELRAIAAQVFGEAYAPTLFKELALTNLGSLTAKQALDAGHAPRDVWHAVCDEMSVSDAARAGIDPRTVIPPRR